MDKKSASHLAEEAARSYPTNAEAQYPLPPSTVSAHLYTDAEHFERELSGVFFKSWMPVIPSSDLPNARDFMVWEELRQSIVITRLDDDSISAWHNVCQHRGARLADGKGNCEKGRFTCPWHGFQYDLSGKLRFSPLKKSFDADKLKDMRAPAVRVEEWCGFIWICLSDEAPSLQEYMGDLWGELGWYGMNGFKVPFRFDVVMDANWKVVVDAFNETWHVPFTHHETLSELMLWRDARLKITPPHSWMTLPVKGFTDAAKEGADHREANVCHYLSFPNTIFSCFPTHLQTWNIWPISPTQTHFCAWGMVGPAPEGVDDASWQKRNKRDWEHFCKVSEEDIGVINGWGKVAQSLGQKEYMFNTAEGRLTAFHAEMAKRTK